MKIALIQTSLIWGSVEENLRLCADRVAGCNGCDLILLPEMFTFGSMMAKVPREVADVEKKEVAVIRVITSADSELIAEHGRLIERYYPMLHTTTYCIEDHYL